MMFNRLAQEKMIPNQLGKPEKSKQVLDLRSKKSGDNLNKAKDIAG